nr:hypothetical protein Ade03nite_91140 [Actinoplanes derwentensis]
MMSRGPVEGTVVHRREAVRLSGERRGRKLPDNEVGAARRLICGSTWTPAVIADAVVSWER